MQPYHKFRIELPIVARHGATVEMDGVDVTGGLTAIKIEADCESATRVTLTYIADNVEIEAEAEVEGEKEPSILDQIAPAEPPEERMRKWKHDLRRAADRVGKVMQEAAV